MSWVLLSYQDVISENKKNQPLPISLNELGPGRNILEHASRRQPHHLILGSYPSPNPCDVLGPCEVQAEHIRDRLGAWHAAKDAAGSPTLVQALLDRGVKRCALQMNESQNTARTRSGTLPCLPKEAHSDTRHGSDKHQRHRAD